MDCHREKTRLMSAEPEDCHEKIGTHVGSSPGPMTATSASRVPCFQSCTAPPVLRLGARSPLVIRRTPAVVSSAWHHSASVIGSKR